jgi:glycosyltransferase involved in cell wall biosynthesis
MKPLNILVLTPWLPDRPNDQHGNFVLDSIESLVSLGHRVHVLVTRPFKPFGKGCNCIQAEMHGRGFSLQCVEYPSIPRNHLRFLSNRLYLWACGWRVRRALASLDADAVHAHTELAGYLACAVAKASGIPVVTTLHGINLDRRFQHGIGQAAFLRRAFACPQRLVLVGKPLFAFVRGLIDSLDHVRVVHNGFREREALPCRNRQVFADPRRINLISVSNLVAGKGIDTNLAALARPEILALPNWHYQVVGDGALRPTLEAQAHQLGIANRVTFHGRQPQDQVFALLARCDVFSLPSAPEAFGVAYLEAMACGLLTIGAQGQGPASFIEDGRTGMLVRERDAGELAARLADVLADPARYAGMAVAGREQVWQHCTWQAHAEAMTDVFHEALATRPAVASSKGTA